VTAGGVALAPATARGVLAELVYLQVRHSIDLARIAMLELDLVDSIGKTYQELGEASPEAPLPVLAGALVEEAWRRVEAEWREGRLGHLDLADAFDDDDGDD
jgi:hypothetical protein